MRKVSFKKKAKTLGGDYKVCASKKQKSLLNKARFVECDGKLFINLKGLKVENTYFGKNFCYACRIDEDRILFMGIKLNDKLRNGLPNVVDALLGVGPYYDEFDDEYKDKSIIESLCEVDLARKSKKRKMARNKMVYLYSSRSDDRVYSLSDEQQMLELLKYNKELSIEYVTTPFSQKQDPYVILSFIERAGLLK
jgi:hypothetical protein